MVATLWLDNEVVTVMSTNSQPLVQEVVQRLQRDRTKADVPCPQAIAYYQRFMGGVDHNDQLRRYYPVRTKCRKFYCYIFWFVFQASVTNSYILHSTYSGAAHQPLKEYHLELAKQLIDNYQRKRRHKRHLAPPTNLSLLHFPMKRKAATPHGTPRGRCWYCWHKRQPQQRRDSQWYCFECQLHLRHTGDINTDCFLLHHKKT